MGVFGKGSSQWIIIPFVAFFAYVVSPIMSAANWIREKLFK